MQGPTAQRQWAIVLAGGDGRRLQELTREISGAPIPKQYCRILGKCSMLETTLQRTQYYAPLDCTLVVINSNHLDIARDQLRQLPTANILIQPCNRDTGPGLLFALMTLANRDPAAVVSIFPSDHYVGDERAFIDHVKRATGIITQHPTKIAVLGIHPDHPEPGYGYILPAGRLSPALRNEATFHVSSFCEKPSIEVARNLLHQGGLWNSFVMTFQARRMLELLRETLPVEFQCLRAAHADSAAMADIYAGLRPWNFSRDFLVHIPQHLLVLQVDDVHWSDWGTRAAIERTLRQLTQAVPWKTGQAPAAAA
jgi:mannose-1-phosphate guanylyltransferase